jgi:hypothetical protein
LEVQPTLRKVDGFLVNRLQLLLKSGAVDKESLTGLTAMLEKYNIETDVK